MLEPGDWQAIYTAISDALPGGQFDQGIVVKADPVKNLIWLEEFGSQPIPVFAFDYSVKYYDTDQTGKILPKHAIVKPVCPSVGDTVLVAKQFGSRRLPKCLGVLRSRDFESITDN